MNIVNKKLNAEVIFVNNSKKDRLSQKQPETVTGIGAGLQIAAANAGESPVALSGNGGKSGGKNKGKNKK